MTTFRLLPLVAAVMLLSSGCALFEPTAIHEAGLISRSRQYELTPDHLAATPMLSEEIRGAQYDADGRLVAAESVIRSWGIPPAPRDLYFAASEELADSETTLRQDSNFAGTAVSAERSQVGNPDTATIAGQTQAARTESTAALVDSLTDKLTATVVRVNETNANRDVEIERIGAQKELELAKLEPVEAEPADVPPDPPGSDTAR